MVNILQNGQNTVLLKLTAQEDFNLTVNADQKLIQYYQAKQKVIKKIIIRRIGMVMLQQQKNNEILSYSKITILILRLSLQLLIQEDKVLQDSQWITQNKLLKSMKDGLQIYLQDHQIKLQLECIKPQNTITVQFYIKSNSINVILYDKGYDVYQVVNKYYSSQHGKSEDAYDDKIIQIQLDMRKSMKKDVEKITMKPTGKKINPEDLEFN